MPGDLVGLTKRHLELSVEHLLAAGDRGNACGMGEWVLVEYSFIEFSKTWLITFVLHLCACAQANIVPFCGSAIDDGDPLGLCRGLWLGAIQPRCKLSQAHRKAGPGEPKLA